MSDAANPYVEALRYASTELRSQAQLAEGDVAGAGLSLSAIRPIVAELTRCRTHVATLTALADAMEQLSPAALVNVADALVAILPFITDADRANGTDKADATKSFADVLRGIAKHMAGDDA